MARFALLVAVVLPLSFPLRAQNVTGSLEGTILDQPGEAVAGANVVVS